MKHLFKKLKSGLMILMAVILSLPLSSLSALAASPSSVQNPGIKYIDILDIPGTNEKIELHKTASPTKNAENKDMVNQWDITLKVVAPKSAQKVDTILVIDRSGSMSGTKMANAKKAAKDLINQLLDGENAETNRVAVVSFASDTTTNPDQDFTNDATLAKEAIEDLSAIGGTHTQAGMRQARTLMKSSSADIKNIVLLSDGQPTYSYALSNPDGYLIDYGTADFETSINAPVDEYLTGNRVGTGNSLREEYKTSHSVVQDINGGYFTTTETLYTHGLFYWEKTPDYEIGGKNYYDKDNAYYIKKGGLFGGYEAYTQPAEKYTITSHTYYYNNGNSAIAEAGYFKDGSQQNVLYTIALDAGEEGTPILNAMASDGKAYEATPESLEGVFADITGKINSTVQNASVEDIMGPGVVIDSASVAGIEGVGVDGNKLTWAIGTPKYDKQLKKYVAELTYRVNVDQSIVGADNNNGFYPANQKAEISYSNEKGEPQPKAEFLIPKINPVFIKITKTIDPEDDICAGSNCTFTFTSNHGHNFVVTEVGKEQTFVIPATQIPEGQIGVEYTLTETAVNGKAEGLNQFTVSQEDYQIGENGLTQTSDDIVAKFKNTVVKRSTPVKVEKKWIGKKTDSVTFNLLANGANTGKSIILNENNEWKGEFDDLRQYDKNGDEIEYTVSESPLDGSYKDPVLSGTMNDTLVITNEYIPQSTVEITGKKSWVKGATPRPDIQLQLLRNGTVQDTVTLIDGETSHTWTGLLDYDTDGSLYTYTVDEVEAPENYDKSIAVSADGLTHTITNTYVSPKIDITARKQWVNGPNFRPAVTLKLYRKIGDTVDTGFEETCSMGKQEVLHNGIVLCHSWTGLDKTNSAAVDYTYYIEEFDVDNYSPTRPTYSLTDNKWDAVVINEYQIPTNGTATATKEWVNGPSAKPTVYLKLYRSLDGGATTSEVPGAVIKELASGTNSATWTGLEKTDINGVLYTFSVKEVDKQGNVLTKLESSLGNYAIAYDQNDAMKVTNTYTPELITITGKKHWVGGSTLPRPNIVLSLVRYIGSNPEEAVPDSTKHLGPNDFTSEPWEVKWENMPATDLSGNTYTYKVKEAGNLGNYASTQTTNWEITNTYVSPTDGTATATKKWANGPSTHPTVWFKLYRSVDGGVTVEEVPESEAPIKELTNGNTSVTWNNLTKTDSEGRNYTFSVKEVNAAGGDFIPANYTKSGEGTLEITNTYKIPTKDITVRKVWEDPFATHPDAIINLLRDGEVVASQVLSNGKWFHTWKVEMTDIDGTPYTYTIEEEKLENYESRIAGSLEDGFIVTNCWQEPGKGEVAAPMTGAGASINPMIMLFALLLVALGIRSYKFAKQIN